MKERGEGEGKGKERGRKGKGKGGRCTRTTHLAQQTQRALKLRKHYELLSRHFPNLLYDERELGCGFAFGLDLPMVPEEAQVTIEGGVPWVAIVSNWRQHTRHIVLRLHWRKDAGDCPV